MKLFGAIVFPQKPTPGICSSRWKNDRSLPPVNIPPMLTTLQLYLVVNGQNYHCTLVTARDTSILKARQFLFLWSLPLYRVVVSALCTSGCPVSVQQWNCTLNAPIANAAVNRTHHLQSVFLGGSPPNPLFHMVACKDGREYISCSETHAKVVHLFNQIDNVEPRSYQRNLAILLSNSRQITRQTWP